MRRLLLITLALSLAAGFAKAGDIKVESPDGHIVATVSDEGGKLSYKVDFDGVPFIETSRLGLTTDTEDFTSGLKIKEASQVKNTKETRALWHTKKAAADVDINTISVTITKNDKQFTLEFAAMNDGIAYRYAFPQYGDTRHLRISGEASSFRFPDKTTTFLCPQITPMTGWMNTKPSYEEEYKADAPMTDKSQYGVGYTFPCLFRIGSDGWALVSETGVDSRYCGARLSDFDSAAGYTVTYPQKGENNGVGYEGAALSLPGKTPWRTVVMGKTLKPIVETTMQFNLVEPLYEASKTYTPMRYVWSWLIWQDNSINFEDQKTMVDLAAEMGYEAVLVDNWWDTQIGRDKIGELVKYARDKGVKIMLWYNTNGYANNAPQGPRDIMNNSIARKREMKWMQKIGVAGIKCDFFGGDKQETMKLYEDIFTDANEYGIAVICHGSTMPRGWERMYPNFIASESSLASENVFFTQHHCDQEGFEMTIHPFVHNAVASFDWGGVIMNRRMSRDNKSRHYRRTSDVFEMATAITNQCFVNCVAVYPNNLEEMPEFVTKWLKKIPTSWDETVFLDGYPGKYFAVARRSGSTWHVAAINGTKEVMNLSLSVPMLAGQTVRYYYDRKAKGDALPEPAYKEVKIDRKGVMKVTLQPLGGAILSPADNNPVLQAFHADPEVLFSKNTGKIYIYPTTDGYDGWGGFSFNVFSTDNLVDFKDEGTILNLRKGNDVAWADGNAWAPSIEEKQIDGKWKYFFYFSGHNPQLNKKTLGVAVADSPTGPFKAAGTPIFTESRAGQMIDSDVFTDPESGTTYLYYGNGKMCVRQLADDMMSTVGEEKVITPQGGTNADYRFREGVCVFYRKGTYYFTWSVDDTGAKNYHVAYGTSKSPLGPIEVADEPIVIIQDPDNSIYGTGHHSVLNIPGTDDWYIVYHRINHNYLGSGPGFHREVCIDKMSFSPDGKINRVTPTNKGVSAIRLKKK